MTAIWSELESLRQHDTCRTVENIYRMKLLSKRFVFLRKCDENSIVKRHEARLVVKCFMHGNVDQTFAPFPNITTNWTCIAMRVHKGYIIHHLDIKNASMHGEIVEEVLVTALDDLDLCGKNKVLKLRRGLYRLKQAPSLWHKKLSAVMKELSFKKLLSDSFSTKRGLSHYHFTWMTLCCCVKMINIFKQSSENWLSTWA